MHFRLSDIAAATGGTLCGDDRIISSVGIDSRQAEPGSLFVPLVAERDGHDFIGSALANGAIAYLCSREPLDEAGESHVAVDDTAVALADLGRLARQRTTGPVVAVTGSVGKTSTKDLCRAAFGAARLTHANRASFNNELGLPLTLVNAPDDTEVTVVEMGARGSGHIAELCAIAEPTIGIITRVALAHSELFGSIEGVAEAKGELAEALPASGFAILNAADANVAAMAQRTDAQVLTYGVEGADVYATDITFDRLLRPLFTVVTPSGSAAVALTIPGEHMVMNALAAISAGIAVGIGIDLLVEGLATALVSPWRMELHETANGAIVINDAYNANPTSMRAALDTLAQLDAARRVAVVGPMAELGDERVDEHVAVVDHAHSLGVDVIAVDCADYGPLATHVPSIPAALEALAHVGPNDAILVKGSRVAGLERLAEILLD